MQQVENQIEKINRLIELRKILNLNQSEMAKKLGISQPKLSAIEKGKEGKDILNNIFYRINYEFGVEKKWWEIGEGKPFLKDKKETTNNNDIEMTKLIQSLEKTVATQEKLIASLEAEIYRLNEENDLLRSKLGNINTGSKAG